MNNTYICEGCGSTLCVNTGHPKIQDGDWRLSYGTFMRKDHPHYALGKIFNHR